MILGYFLKSKIILLQNFFQVKKIIQVKNFEILEKLTTRHQLKIN